MNVRVGVGIFVIQNGMVLIGKRKSSHGDGTYQLPGGHLEFKESFLECAVREVKEETNLDVDNTIFLTATNDIFLKENKHYVTVFMKAYVQLGSAQLLTMEKDKCEYWKWVPFTEIKNLSPAFQPLHNLIQSGQFDILSQSF
jgi:8-oxo-dGTP diphosphatase